MIFNSFQFLWLFPIIFVVYYATSWLAKKINRDNRLIGNLLLIAISYGLYMQWKPEYALVLLAITAITYFSAILIEKRQAFHQKKYIIITGSVLALMPLLIFKYTGFICETVTNVMEVDNSLEVKLLAPVGISFYTFQAVGYLMDVYHQRIKAERNWWDYMLFVCFFPQILSGPISRAQDLLPQIKTQREFKYDNAVKGLKWLLWGMFMKVAMADRLALYVNPVLDNYQYNSGVSCLLANIFYTFQIYGDFAGYSLMAIGVGKLMGFSLVNNFKRPYLSASVTEFWKRWHISLTRWLTTHVYIAMGGNRCAKPRQYWNIIITFLVSGIWHGANWTFIVWGAIHGVFQIIEKALGLQKTDGNHWLVKIPRIIITFLIVNFAWLFFRMPTIGDAYHCFVRMFTVGGALFVGSRSDVLYIILAICIVAVKDILGELKPNKYGFESKYKFVRWSCYSIVTMYILLFGVFDAGQFIYLSF